MKTLIAAFLFALFLFTACHDPDFSSQPTPTNPYITVTTPLADPATVDMQPIVIRFVAVEYPSLAWHAGLEGTVSIAAHVTEHGEVDSTQILQSPAFHALDYAVEKAAIQYIYLPANRDGHRVACWVSYSVIFDLP